jgi:hypothetical protein
MFEPIVKIIEYYSHPLALSLMNWMKNSSERNVPGLLFAKLLLVIKIRRQSRLSENGN